MGGAWNWPAEWAVDEKFWREVATRTVAGILTLVFLGLPGVIFAMSTGALTAEQGMPIVIGASIIIGFIVLYTLAQVVVRAIARYRIINSLKASREPETIRISLTPEGYGSFAKAFLDGSRDAQTDLMKGLSEGVKVALTATSAFASIASTTVSIVIAILTVVISAFTFMG
jgi:hypothetical protein